MTFAVGDVVAGKFRIERVIGQGGMGEVLAATHLQLGRLVALKVLLPEVARNKELVARFSREAQAAGRIQSEHVAKVLDVGALDDGTPFMVMEHLEGGDLAALVKARGRLPGQDAVEYVLQASEALAEAHAAGIVHRDLKPANLFLTARPDGSPSIKVLDFGISKIVVEGQAGMTQTQAVMGSPNYMAPEQLKSSRHVDARTDIWSIGIILQELLTGEVAFKADTVPELYVAILQDRPTPLRQRRPDAPPGMEAIVARCLEKDPARRFQNVAELAAALDEFAPARARFYVERIHRILGVAPPAAAAPVPPQVAPPYAPGAYAPPTQSSAPPMPVYPQYQQPPPAYGSYGPPVYSPHGSQYGMAPQRPVPRGMSGATVGLLILLGFIVLGGGSCAMCVCISAADQPRQQPAHR